MDKKLVFLDSVLLQQDMRIRLPKSVLVNIDGKAGETRLDVYFDAITKEIILRNSDNQNNKESKTKNKVKTICIDIYPPYMDIIKKHFPNARIIIDRFHIIQNINRELNKERVRLMNIYRGKKGKKGRNYTILKNF